MHLCGVPPSEHVAIPPRVYQRPPELLDPRHSVEAAERAATWTDREHRERRGDAHERRWPDSARCRFFRSPVTWPAFVLARSFHPGVSSTRWPSRPVFRDEAARRESVMNRRTFLASIAGGLLAAPLAALAIWPLGAPVAAVDNSQEAWTALVNGGHVALVRHGNAPPGYGGDPPGFK